MRKRGLLFGTLATLGIAVCAYATPPCPDLDTDPYAEFVTFHLAGNAITLTEDDGAVHTFYVSNPNILFESCLGTPQILADAYNDLGDLNDIRKKANFHLRGNGVDANGIPRPCVTGYLCVRY